MIRGFLGIIGGVVVAAAMAGIGQAHAQSLLDVGAALYHWDRYDQGVVERDGALLLAPDPKRYGDLEYEIVVEAIDQASCKVQVKKWFNPRQADFDSRIVRYVRSHNDKYVRQITLENARKYFLEHYLKITFDLGAVVFAEASVSTLFNGGLRVTLPGVRPVYCEAEYPKPIDAYAAPVPGSEAYEWKLNESCQNTFVANASEERAARLNALIKFVRGSCKGAVRSGRF